MTAHQPKKAGALQHAVELTKSIIPPVHPGGRPFILGALGATLAVRRLSKRAGVGTAVFTAWLAWFFREPKRVTPRRPGIAVAPADGTVSHVVEAVPPAELGLGDEPMLRVSVFLSVFDVHVQRSPATGQVVRAVHKAGKFLSADLDEASEVNERNSLHVRTDEGHDLAVVQIAGLVARRIICQVSDGDKVLAGSTYGLIRFGSRVDLYVPADSRVLVEPGQRTIGGETVLAELPSAG
ncbi:phosphatidylserine decarboxylase [Actinokineospora globicatena]|uniref:Phosphatidylserine decarboxylase proenzyme n=1 Tax=Actinokineospora globicatena TaxID=103729 RepID=A0A9W6VBJ2_9PSEU|nr:phosphatidylserine decarboxylase [Actinokineospora globicatena]GLW93033.1 phosphatidylserine decarboxylase proenzyme [Actinokineospora globicatena]